MLKTMTPARLLLNTLMVSTALMLAACQTTGSTGAGAVNANKDPIDAALQRAAAEGNTVNAPETLASIERLYKQDSTNPDLAVRYARALRDNGRMTRAAMVLNPLIENPKTKTTAVITEYAAVQASMGNYEIAEKNARAAIMKDSNSAQAYHILGIALDAQGFSKQAEVAFRKALDNWSGDPSPVLNNLGLNLAAQGFLDESISTLRRAAALSPNKQEIERNLRIVQALQVQPGTNTVPYSQTKADQSATKKKSAPSVDTPADAKPVVKPEAKAKTETKAKSEATAKPAAKNKVTTAESAPPPAQKKSGGIVVEDLNGSDKAAVTEVSTDDKHAAPPAMAKPRGLNE